MNFCNNCGHKIENVKFCSNCGAKIEINKNNKIDNSVNFVKKNVNLVSNEIKESEVVNTFKTKTIPKLLNKISDVLGVFGLITIVAQIIISLVKTEPFHFQEAYSRYENSSFEYLVSGFLAEISFTTILPFIFMFWSGLRNKGLLAISILLIFVLYMTTKINENKITIDTINNSKSDQNIEDNSTINDSTASYNSIEENIKNDSKADINKLLDNLNPNLIENENIRIVNNSSYSNKIDFSFIKKYQNQYSFNEICSNKILNDELRNKFGNDLFELFIQNINVQNPIKIENEEVFMSACLPHSCGYNESVLFVDFINDKYFAAILDDENIYITTNYNDFSKSDIPSLPKKLLYWIKNSVIN